MRLAETVTFGGLGGLDRAAHLRDKVGVLRADPRSRAVPLWRGKPMLVGHSLALLPLDHPIFADPIGETLFLGLHEGDAIFAIDLSSWQPQGHDSAAQAAFADLSQQLHPATPQDHHFIELRQVMVQLSPLHAEIAATARGMFEWHRSHRFCPRCAGKLVPTHSGWQQQCQSCQGMQFPRSDAVVIMLVTHGNDVLLGRSHGWPEGMYSLLAGFIEPGETVEAAVRREVFEEAGVRVGQVGYLASQPWPFPASLMLGFHAEATSREIKIDPAEIEDAIWISREELIEVFAGCHPKVRGARKGAIAHFLMQAWLADQLD